ncbi:HotDog domain-containing protein [Mucor mucedo]|uniref:HotDog domain-containing protein n=1 Tax=Mucor mucedo TaxID=29922 RepID=UPI00221FED5E|nr:HotDog domain-containing protein [Mucor mucedo]KAI7889316.1 HotDog domain-containing protein [Mucor mucedo]
MSGSQKRISLIASHLATSSVQSRTLTTQAVKETFRKRQDYKYFLPIQSRWSDNDCYGHINNSIYYHYFDTIINEYLIRKCGLEPGSQTKPIGLVVASHANFYASASYPNLIMAGLAVSKLGKSSVTYRVGIFESENPLACVVGGFTHVFVNNGDRRPVTQLPEEIITGVKDIAE